jgi:hypothetical protein
VVVTPGDILARCRSLDARIHTATQAIESAPNVFDAEFRNAWSARLRRWQELRNQCAEWAGRMWNYKWEPRLDDWFANQATWEQEIEKRSGRALPVPQQIKPDEQPKWPSAPELPNLKETSNKIAVGVGVAAVLGVAIAALALRAKKD